MSKVEFTEETVKKVAHLARLELSSSEITKFTSQIGQVLGYIEKLNELDTKNVEPMTSALNIETPMREDEVRPSLGSEVMLANAPEQIFETFKVPQVIASRNEG